jgi:hypothetical protein
MYTILLGAFVGWEEAHASQLVAELKQFLPRCAAVMGSSMHIVSCDLTSLHAVLVGIDNGTCAARGARPG